MDTILGLEVGGGSAVGGAINLGLDNIEVSLEAVDSTLEDKVGLAGLAGVGLLHVQLGGQAGGLGGLLLHAALQRALQRLHVVLQPLLLQRVVRCVALFFRFYFLIQRFNILIYEIL